MSLSFEAEGNQLQFDTSLVYWYRQKMQTSMTGRPRPVTATVTKPRWMQIPDPDAIAKIRSRSLESHASTDSLTSFLDHDSYVSENDTENGTHDNQKGQSDNRGTPDSNKKTRPTRNENRGRKNKSDNKIENSREISPAKSKSADSNMSAWEQWVVRKAKDDQRKKQEERQKKKEAKALKEKEEHEKQVKLTKAEVVRQQWTEKKDQEWTERQKMEKMKVQNDKRKKEELDQQIQQKAAEKFALWTEMKKKEERVRRRRIKEENLKIQQHEERRKVMAEERFKQWLHQAKGRPKSAPNSFGYLAGKMTGYHDRSAYPQPTFCNPVPWQPPSIPSSQKAEKPRKPAKVKPYKWNPEKYF
ncbi:coiled-coil domain-containing protein 34 isoform X1 [Aplysia californica]|uniref:Coiled-coil domain-containing protein 34 isoform X1 n=2 Tax=Aplysia californica TaxID=6500 RepID=A0ABM0ZZV1_APLCA|nr:coiled-coil domain-containing protein 34 isoform X1 [Aplysia californica]